jgi:SAM-dependent methyltransferase
MEMVEKGKSGFSKPHVCPWWLAYAFDNPLRRLIHPPEKVLRPYVRQGMTTLDIGCGFGHFSLGMACLVGEQGRVIAADVQDKMLEKAMHRARRTGLDDIILPHKCAHHSLGLDVEIDFALASNVLHETADLLGILTEVYSLLKPGGLFYVMEPVGHIKPAKFEAEIALAVDVGFNETERPKLFRERCVVLQKPGKERRLNNLPIYKSGTGTGTGTGT